MNLFLPTRSTIIDGARALWMRARAELKAWASPVLNPFVGQMMRAETRGKSLWRLPMVMALLWAGPVLLDWLASFDIERDLANDAALFWIAIAFVVALVARLLRCESLLRVEIIKNRFEPLQLLPIAAARRAWLWSAPATLFALLVCSLTLPAVFWGLGSGLFTPGDAFGLTLLALMLSWGRPLWRPTMWRGQIAKNSADAANRGDGFVAPPAPPSQLVLWLICGALVIFTLSVAGVGADALSAYWLGLPVYLRASGDEFWMTWPLFAARWLVRAQPFLGFSLAPMFLVLPAYVAGAVCAILRLSAVTAIEPYWTQTRLRLWRRARRIVGASWGALVFGLLWPGSIDYAWMSRWFTGAPTTRETALAAWWLAALAMASLGASALWWRALGAEETNANAASANAASATATDANVMGANASAANADAMGATATNTIAIATATGANVLTATATNADATRANATTATALKAMNARASALATSTETVQARLRRAARASARGALGVLAVFIVVHVLGAAWPLGAFWRQIAPASLAVAAVFWGAQAATLGGMSVPRLESALWRWHLLWLCGVPITTFALDMVGLRPDSYLPNAFFFSPWTLWLALRDPNIGANPAFWNAIAVHAALVAATALLVWRQRETPVATAESALHPQATNAQSVVAKMFKSATAQTSATRETEAPFDQTELPTDDESSSDDDEEEAEPNVAASALRRAPLEAPEGALISLLRWLERFDNPLLLLETRRVVGNSLSNTVNIAGIATGSAALVFGLVLPVVWLRNGGLFADYLPVPLCLMLAIFWALPLLGIDGASRAYDQDRLDGSLQALFLTPRTESELASGKLGPYLARGALMLVLFGPMWLLGLIFCRFAGEPLIVAAYAAMPIFAASFALRIATVSHWMAIVKRRVGVGSVPTSVTLGAIVALPTEAGLLLWGGATSATMFFAVGLLLSIGFAAQALGFWRLGLRALRRQRFRGVPTAD